MIAWLAPGQGMEQPGLERALFAAWPEVARDLPRTVHTTDRAQPWLVGIAVAVGQVLRDAGVPCDAVAGHSVGELAAWSVAGGISADDAVALAEVRGRSMADASVVPGGMRAFDTVPDLPDGWVVAVENPGQVVVSGPEPGPPGRRVATSGAWHHPGMAVAQTAFRAALDALPSRSLQVPIASNHDGSLVHDDAVFRRHLVAQLTHRVRWTTALQALRDVGVTDVVVLGPGKALAAHARAMGWDRERIHRTDRPDDVRAVVRALG